MWDIIGYVEKEVSLLIRKGGVYYVLNYPWKTPSAVPLLLASPKAEAIKITDQELFEQLRVRALAHALNHTCAMSRGALLGKTADNISDLVRESLKFALRRRKSDLASPQDFIQMLMSCAILEPIPDGFWRACSGFMSDDAVTKLKTSLEALHTLRPKDDAWLKSLTSYLQRVKWIQNDFTFIQTVARQMAASYRDHECGPMLNELRIQASNLIQREEIEKDMATQKPWQKSAIPVKRAIKIGPSAAPRKQAPKDDDSGAKS